MRCLRRPRCARRRGSRRIAVRPQRRRCGSALTESREHTRTSDWMTTSVAIATEHSVDPLDRCSGCRRSLVSTGPWCSSAASIPKAVSSPNTREEPIEVWLRDRPLHQRSNVERISDTPSAIRQPTHAEYRMPSTHNAHDALAQPARSPRQKRRGKAPYNAGTAVDRREPASSVVASCIRDAPRSPGTSLRCRVRIDHHLLVAERRAWSVRVATVDDFDALFAMVDAVVGEDKWLGAQPPLDRDVTIDRWRSDVDDPHAVRFVVEDRRRIVGEANAHLAGGRADLGMQVAEAYRGLGVGTVLVSAIVDWAPRTAPTR